jgi:hypothetical protein
MPDQIERRVYNVENDLHLIKLAINNQSHKTDMILQSINDLKMSQSSQRGFFAGLEKAGATFIAFIGAIAALIAFFFDHIFGKH